MSAHGTAYPWPEGKRAGLCVSFDFDGESPHLWRTRQQRPPGVAELEQRRFGPARGVWRVLEVLSRLQLRASFFLPGWVAATYPDAVRAVHAEGHEVALHGWLHEPPTDLSDDELERTLTRASATLAELTGVVPTGYRSPSWQMTTGTFEVLRSLGVTWDSSLMGDDRPYSVEGLTEVPVDWATDDAPYYRYTAGDARPPAFPGELVSAWADEVAAAHRYGSLCLLTMHPFLSGRAARLAGLEDLLADVLTTEDLYVGTVGDLAAHHAGLAEPHTAPRSLAWPADPSDEEERS